VAADESVDADEEGRKGDGSKTEIPLKQLKTANGVDESG
jgi:hypothetical protein